MPSLNNVEGIVRIRKNIFKRIRALEEQLLADLDFHGIVGKSPAMLEVFDLARKVAKHYNNADSHSD